METESQAQPSPEGLPPSKKRKHPIRGRVRKRQSARASKSERQQAKRALQPVPWVATPSARAVAKNAAEAVGMELDEFLELISDAGLLALPPKANVPLSQSYSLGDLGKRLWGSMQEVSPQDRPAWFAALGPRQQGAMVVVLKTEGFASDVIAREFSVTLSDVMRLWNEYCDDIGSQVVGMRLSSIAGQLQIHADLAQSIAIGNRDASLIWRISKEYTEALQGLGIVDRAIQRVEHTHAHTHTFEERRKEEIDALVSLEMKKKQFAEDSKVIDAEFFESPPESSKGFGEDSKDNFVDTDMDQDEL